MLPLPPPVSTAPQACSRDRRLLGSRLPLASGQTSHAAIESTEVIAAAATAAASTQGAAVAAAPFPLAQLDHFGGDEPGGDSEPQDQPQDNTQPGAPGPRGHGGSHRMGRRREREGSVPRGDAHRAAGPAAAAAFFPSASFSSRFQSPRPPLLVHEAWSLPTAAEAPPPAAEAPGCCSEWKFSPRAAGLAEQAPGVQERTPRAAPCQRRCRACFFAPLPPLCLLHARAAERTSGRGRRTS